VASLAGGAWADPPPDGLDDTFKRVMTNVTAEQKRPGTPR
jgi:hypothetical protein